MGNKIIGVDMRVRILVAVISIFMIAFSGCTSDLTRRDAEKKIKESPIAILVFDESVVFGKEYVVRVDTIRVGSGFSDSYARAEFISFLKGRLKGDWRQLIDCVLRFEDICEGYGCSSFDRNGFKYTYTALNNAARFNSVDLLSDESIDAIIDGIESLYDKSYCWGEPDIIKDRELFGVSFADMQVILSILQRGYGIIPKSILAELKSQSGNSSILDAEPKFLTQLLSPFPLEKEYTESLIRDGFICASYAYDLKEEDGVITVIRKSVVNGTEKLLNLGLDRDGKTYYKAHAIKDVKVTGITANNVEPGQRIVEFTITYNPNYLGEALNWRSFTMNKKGLFVLYDDGWRFMELMPN